ncbi:uncharacterized protein LOC111373626 [Olea europaea var. sylvestris]|uniref:Uncharacterized protein n=1 Tax=Olea europaea subsp. europaea TaxID=158383 RepID=A0A8S0V7A3_OLEEU|nr:uncharacterized protein LOC111373626 [Olea europaea var. sylvestris]CAA3027299.1 Hypothetical predicted protein [Olea europaea subsp. europaea]
MAKRKCQKPQTQKPMSAALPLPHQRPWLPNTISTTRPPLPQRSVSFAVKSLKSDHQDKESAQYIGGASALKSNKPLRMRNTFNKSRNQQNPESKDEQKRQLSGADVLWALQRATAHKSKKKKDKRDTISGDGKFVEREIQGAVDYTSVRPLCIKTEWIARLEELERQLQELIDT